MKCCICHREIEPVGTWKEGNNAEPIKNGRCCDNCNVVFVIPARLLEVNNYVEKKEKKDKKH